MRLLRYLLGFYAGFLLTMVPVILTIGGWFLLDVWLPSGWALGIPCFLLMTYMGVDQYRRDKRRAQIAAEAEKASEAYQFRRLDEA